MSSASGADQQQQHREDEQQDPNKLPAAKGYNESGAIHPAAAAADTINPLDSILNNAEVDPNVYMQLMSKTATGTHANADQSQSAPIQQQAKRAKSGGLHEETIGSSPNDALSPTNNQMAKMNYMNHMTTNNPMYAASNLQNVSNPLMNNPAAMQPYGQAKQGTLLQKMISNHHSMNVPPVKYYPSQMQQNVPNYHMGYPMNQHTGAPQMKYPNQMNPNQMHGSPQFTTPNESPQQQQQAAPGSQLSNSSSSPGVGGENPHVTECLNLFRKLVEEVKPKSPQLDMKTMITNLVRNNMTPEDFVEELRHLPEIESENLLTFLRSNLPMMRAYAERSKAMPAAEHPALPSNNSSYSNQNQQFSPSLSVGSQSGPTFRHQTTNNSKQFVHHHNPQQQITTQSPFFIPQTRTTAMSQIPNVPHVNLEQLQRIILSISTKEITEMSDEVPKIIANALHLKLSQIVNKLYLTTYHRIMTKKMPIVAQDSKYMVREVENPKKLINILNNISENDQRYVDAHNFLSMIKSGDKNKLKEMLAAKSTSNAVINSQAAVEAERQRDANKTAMAALSSLMKKPKPEVLASDSDKTKSNKPVNVTYKATKKDLIYVLEHDKQAHASLALYQAHLT